ncbi:transglutaminase [Bosea sp. Root483D1]|uniref:transglutaminase-like domain-containing protein n=1 Tax=Bosea sp. Root483D1 TaxID=1736544 RepID=UPI00070CC70E|nr:transglutaminase family protein [Bosea sp. Root483D1]KRE24814.1 transglutaminase [Bosea sp. Root483D1]
MQIRYGYRIEVICEQPTALLTLLDIHPSRRHGLIRPDEMRVMPVTAQPATIKISEHLDPFGNICRRFTVPAGGAVIACDGLIYDSGEPDVAEPAAQEVAPADLPDEVLPYLLGSRYCETDRLAGTAWSLFGQVEPGWARVQAVTQFVHNHISFGYAFARSTRTAAEAFAERIGVCRDFAHLAIALCRCLNIPARYCNGYLGDIGVVPNPAPMDFNAWFEVWLGGRWHTFDARHNQRRIGRIVLARGRDATDVPMITSFGPHELRRFEVITEEVEEEPIRLSPTAVRLVPAKRDAHIAA